MRRTPLSCGHVVQSPKLLFEIDSVIGKGANCVVYKAHYTDSSGYSKNVILKECYPHFADITRNDDMLIWNNTEETKAAYDRFQRTYDLEDKMQKSGITNSASVITLDMFRANGTQYIVSIPQNEPSYDKNSNTSIIDILRTALALCNAVGLYHQAGYLHLDVKPSNFIVTDDHTRQGKNIALFDLDTLVSFEELNSQSIKSVSYSDGFAAPEQKQQQIKKLCPATDLFAVGAVLFSRIMNRGVENYDMSPFASWMFDERFDTRAVNPMVKRLLREIFHKSLAANVKKRYQTADEMAFHLEEVLRVLISRVPFLITNCPPVPINLVGRKKELNLIRECFSSNQHVVVLHGDGGIGKSTLATLYGNTFRQDYDAVIFLRYHDSIESTLYSEQISIGNYDEYHQEDYRQKDESIRENRRVLVRSLLDKNSLLILDNFDVMLDEDDYISELLRLNANIIITSRTDFSFCYNGMLTQLEISALEKDDLLTVFSHAADTKPTAEEELKLSELFTNLGGNTFIVELLGKQVSASGYSICALIEKVSCGLFSLEKSERIVSLKDERVVRKTIPDIIRLLYNLADLSDQEKQALRNLYLLHFLNIDRQTYLSFNREKPYNLNVVNDLVERGWVHKSKEYYSLHPLVEELIGKEMTPNKDNCQWVFFSFAYRLSQCLDEPDIYLDARQYAFDRNCELISRFLSRLDFSDDSNLHTAVDWLIELIKASTQEETLYSMPGIFEMNPVLLKLQSIAEIGLNNRSVYFDICYILFAFWLYEFRSFYTGEEDYCISRENRREKGLFTSFERITESINLLPESDREHALDREYSLISSYLENYGAGICITPKSFVSFLSQRYDERPQCFSENIPEFVFKDLSSVVNSDDDCSDKNEKEPDVMEASDEGIITEDPVDCVRSIAADNTLSVLKRIGRIQEQIEQQMEPLFSVRFIDLRSRIDWPIEDWLMLKKMLEIQNELISLFDNQEALIAAEGNYLHDSVVIRHHLCLIVVCAALNDIESFRREMKRLLSIYPNYDLLFYEMHSLRFYLFELEKLQNALARIQKTRWLLPYLVGIGDRFSQFFSAEDEDEALYYIYVIIIDCAEFAAAECDISKDQATEYLQIAKEYRRKTNRVLDVDFSFRSEE